MSSMTCLLTRPEPNSLAAALTQAGKAVQIFPCISIAPVTHSTNWIPAFDQLGSATLALFVSRNAVKYGLPHIYEQVTSWPLQCAIAAIGPSTQDALANTGLETQIIPDSVYSSEGLLAHPALESMQGQQVIIICGMGGA